MQTTQLSALQAYRTHSSPSLTAAQLDTKSVSLQSESGDEEALIHSVPSFHVRNARSMPAEQQYETSSGADPLSCSTLHSINGHHSPWDPELLQAALDDIQLASAASLEPDSACKVTFDIPQRLERPGSKHQEIGFAHELFMRSCMHQGDKTIFQYLLKQALVHASQRHANAVTSAVITCCRAYHS